MAVLILAEKPSVGRDIAKGISGQKKVEKTHIIAGDYVITWGIGHLLQLYDPADYDEKYSKWNLGDLPIFPNSFLYKPITNTGSQFKAIKKLLASHKFDYVILATDADREGELIGRLILKEAGWKGPVKRFWTSEALTPDVVRKALKSLKDDKEFDGLYMEALARQHADWLVGINESRAVTLLAGGKGNVLSVGRVQTALLTLLAEREKEIRNFVPTPYWTVTVNINGIDFKLADKDSDDYLKFNNKAEAEKVAREIERIGKATVESYESKEVREGPPLLFSLSVLQKEANKIYGFSGNTVLGAAQSLYEVHKVTSYPRTSCEHLASTNRDLVVNVMKELSLDSSKINKHVFNDKKVGEAGHHAIIPLRLKSLSSKSFSDTEAKVFDLICRRFKAAVAGTPAITEQITVRCKIGNYELCAKSSVCVDKGWHVFYPPNWKPSEEKPLVQFKSLHGKGVKVEKVTVDDRKTEPPRRYTEGDVISLMKNVWQHVSDPALKEALKESNGIGTEATRAAIIETLKERGYIVSSGKSVKVTDLGLNVADVVKQLNLTVADITTTAVWEMELDKISKGRRSYLDFVNEIKNLVKKEISMMVSNKDNMKDIIPTVKCPCCSAGEVKFNKAGAFCDCGLKLWSKFLNKTLKPEQLKMLLEGKKLLLKNLEGKSGKTFSAYISLDVSEKKLKMDFVNENATKDNRYRRAPSPSYGRKR